MGLDEIIEDAKKRLSAYENAIKTGNYENTILSSFADAYKKQLCESLLNEHTNEIEVYKMAKNFGIK